MTLRISVLAAALHLGCSATGAPVPTATLTAPPEAVPTSTTLPAGTVDLQIPSEQLTLMFDRVSDEAPPRIVVLARMLAVTSSPGGASSTLTPGADVIVRDGSRTLGATSLASCRAAGDRAADLLMVPASASVHVWCTWYADDPTITSLGPQRHYDVEVQVATATSSRSIRVMGPPMVSRTHVDPLGQFVLSYPEPWTAVVGTAERVLLASARVGCEVELMRSNSMALPAGRQTEIQVGMRRYPAVLTSSLEREWVLDSSASVYGDRWRIRAACSRRGGGGPEEITDVILPLWRKA